MDNVYRRMLNELTAEQWDIILGVLYAMRAREITIKAAELTVRTQLYGNLSLLAEFDANIALADMEQRVAWEALVSRREQAEVMRRAQCSKLL